MRKLLVVSVLATLCLLLSASCSLIPVRSAPHVSLRQYCVDAARQGWCENACGRRRPEHCKPMKCATPTPGAVFVICTGVDGGLYFFSA
jgi:hypothetical protein